jgi:hypothetical protein
MGRNTINLYIRVLALGMEKSNKIIDLSHHNVLKLLYWFKRNVLLFSRTTSDVFSNAAFVQERGHRQNKGFAIEKRIHVQILLSHSLSK